MPLADSIKFSKESADFENNSIDGQDPQDLALKYHAIMRITNMISDEYKEMYASSYNKDIGTQMNMKEGFQGFKSDSSDCVLDHCAHFPMTIVLFYDENIYLTSIMKSLASKILDVFRYKFEQRLLAREFRNFSDDNKNYNQF